MFNFQLKFGNSEPMLTPCIGVCELDAKGFCTGCLRTGDEIGRWSTMTAAERQHVMDQVLPAREAASNARP